MLGERRWIKPIELTDLIPYHKYDIREHVLFAIWFPMLRIVPGTQRLLKSSCKMNKKKDENEESSRKLRRKSYLASLNELLLPRHSSAPKREMEQTKRGAAAKALRSPHVHTAGVLSVPWATYHTPWRVATPTSLPHPGELCDYQK